MSAIFNLARKSKKEPEDLSKVFYFTSNSPFSVELNDTSTKTWDGVIEYSFDNENWVTFEPTTVVTCSRGNGGKIYFRGTVNHTLSGDRSDAENIDDNDDPYAFFKLTGSKIACRGDITVLLDYLLLDDPTASAPVMSEYCLYHLFKNCTSLVEASFIIPSFIDGYECCTSMFYGCSNLRVPPIIRMSKASENCFANMFKGCSSLISPPNLPLTTLADACYFCMFYGCTSLTTAPELPATVLTYGCYYNMFYGCTSLITAPRLPATVLTFACYYEMFRGCSSLEIPPILSATTLAESCCNGMFYDCTSLTIAPELPATTLAENCYYQMFYNCTSLTTAMSSLPAIIATTNCYYQMFYNCTSLTTTPRLLATTLANACYGRMFKGCSSLEIPPALPATVTAENCYNEMFYDCTALIALPALPATSLAKNCYVNMFRATSSGSALISASQTDDKTVEWRLPYNSSDTAVVEVETNRPQLNMFYSRGDIIPKLNTTYYTSAVVSPDGNLITS